MPLAALRASIVLRLVAALFVCVILTDIAAEGHCDDGLVASTSRLAFSASDVTDADACGQVCVPDCYCCAGGVEHATVRIVAGQVPVDLVPVAASPSTPEGVRPLPYRPPLFVA